MKGLRRVQMLEHLFDGGIGGIGDRLGDPDTVGDRRQGFVVRLHGRGDRPVGGVVGGLPHTQATAHPHGSDGCCSFQKLMRSTLGEAGDGLVP